MNAGIGAVWLGRMSFAQCLDLQLRTREGVIAGEEPETLFLVEHPPTLTLGRRGQAQDILWPAEVLRAKGIDVCETPRGGEVTLHAPGQVVAYPVVTVGRQIRRHITDLGTSACRLAAELDVAGLEFRMEHPGVWLGPKKLGSIGIHVSRGVSVQGMSFNLAVDPGLFGALVSCGVPGIDVTSLVSVGGRKTPVEAAARAWAQHFAQVSERPILAWTGWTG